MDTPTRHQYHRRHSAICRAIRARDTAICHIWRYSAPREERYHYWRHIITGSRAINNIISSYFGVIRRALHIMRKRCARYQCAHIYAPSISGEHTLPRSIMRSSSLYQRIEHYHIIITHIYHHTLTIIARIYRIRSRQNGGDGARH